MYKDTRLSPQLSDSKGRKFDNIDTKSLRVYHVWKGNNKFFLGGRIVFGPDVKSIFLTVFLIVAPVILFSAFVSQMIIEELPHHVGKILITICIVFTAYVIVLLFLTSGRDPGIIPRNLHPPEDDIDGSSLCSDWPGSHRRTSSLPPVKDVIVNGMIVRVKYCQTCMLYRPPRCSHCSICNNCVERFDHHCPWVGQCIGKRNYRFFFMFVSSTTILCTYVFALCWVNIGKIMEGYRCDLWRAFEISPVSGILILYTFVIDWFVGGLTAFHLYLIFSNQTTYENFRYGYHGKVSPYNRGCAQNIGEVFFSKIPRSKNDFRAKVNVDSSPVDGKTNFDIEMGKQKAVADEDFEDVHSQNDSIGTMERVRTPTSQTNWDHEANWAINPDLQMLAAEFGLEHGATARERIHVAH